jgi:hypothetical protein
MASTLIHIVIADKVNKYLKMNDKELFLGTIAPDLAKEIGLTKAQSHFITQKDSDTPNVYLFHKKYGNTLDNPYNMGYFIHLLVDKKWYTEFTPYYYWDQYDNEIKTKHGIIKVSDEKEKEIVYGDYTALNHYLLDHYNPDLEVFYNPFELPKTNIIELDSSKISLLVDKMGMILRDANSTELKLFNAKEIDNFINESANEIIYMLEHMK